MLYPTKPWPPHQNAHPGPIHVGTNLVLSGCAGEGLWCLEESLLHLTCEYLRYASFGYVFFFDSFDRKHYKFRSLVHCCWWVVSPTRFLSNYLYRQNWIRSIPQVWLGRDFSDPQTTLKKSTFAFLGHWSWQWYDKRRGDLHPPQWIKSNDLFFEISSRKLSGISCTKIHYLLPFWGKRCHEV